MHFVFVPSIIGYFQRIRIINHLMSILEQYRVHFMGIVFTNPSRQMLKWKRDDLRIARFMFGLNLVFSPSLSVIVSKMSFQVHKKSSKYLTICFEPISYVATSQSPSRSNDYAFVIAMIKGVIMAMALCQEQALVSSVSSMDIIDKL